MASVKLPTTPLLAAALLAAALLVACASSPPPDASAPAVASAPGIATSSAPAPPAPPSTPGEVLERNRTAFDACYAQARSADAALGRTKVEITFAVSAEGVPQTVDLKYRNRFDEKSKDCMREAALAARFPASMQGSQTAVIAFAPAP
jgi:hypothetical protein